MGRPLDAPIEIAPCINAEEWQNLNLDDPNSLDWQRAIEIFEKRIRGRFFQAVEQIEGLPFSGFAIMALDCLLIRNGIFHQAEIKGKSRLRIKLETLVQSAPDGEGLVLDRRQFHQALIAVFERYLERLRDPANKDLRARFRRKMDAIGGLVMSDSIAILAFGSLLDDPGAELEPFIIARQPVRTPFRVEFARSSQKRAGAPTLVPVACEGIGAFVQAQLLVFKPEVSVEQAADMLYRREIGKVGSGQPYDAEKAHRRINGVRVGRLEDFAGMEVVLYASPPANLAWVLDPELNDEVKAKRLAHLAIKSVTPQTYSHNRDGIYYLERAIANGIETPLTASYREAILRKAGTATLAEAREVALRWYQGEKG